MGAVEETRRLVQDFLAPELHEAARLESQNESRAS